MNKKRLFTLICIFSTIVGISCNTNAMRYLKVLTTASRTTGLRRMLSIKPNSYDTACKALFNGLVNRNFPIIFIHDINEIYEKIEGVVNNVSPNVFFELEKAGKLYMEADTLVEKILENLEKNEKEPEV